MEIYCDCSDCGNTRLTGKCLLEQCYREQTGEFLPDKYREEIRMFLRRRKKESHQTVLKVTSF